MNRRWKLDLQAICVCIYRGQGWIVLFSLLDYVQNWKLEHYGGLDLTLCADNLADTYVG